MSVIHKFSKEIKSARRLLVPGDFVRWRRGLIMRLPAVLRRRSLGPVDDYLGEKFSFTTGGHTLRLTHGSFGVVREIFGQECYLVANNAAPFRTIVDLGANCGTFTLFALVHAPEARVLAVEAQPALANRLKENLGQNGFSDRVTVRTGVVGGAYDTWSQQLLADTPGLHPIFLDELLADETMVDFLKCDIEGAEFQVITPDAKWLQKVRCCSIEYHGTIAAGTRLQQILSQHGFTTQRRDHRDLGYVDGSRGG